MTGPQAHARTTPSAGRVGRRAHVRRTVAKQVSDLAPGPASSLGVGVCTHQRTRPLINTMTLPDVEVARRVSSDASDDSDVGRRLALPKFLLPPIYARWSHTFVIHEESAAMASERFRAGTVIERVQQRFGLALSNLQLTVLSDKALGLKTREVGHHRFWTEEQIDQVLAVVEVWLASGVDIRFFPQHYAGIDRGYVAAMSLLDSHHPSSRASRAPLVARVLREQQEQSVAA